MFEHAQENMELMGSVKEYLRRKHIGYANISDMAIRLNDNFVIQVWNKKISFNTYGWPNADKRVDGLVEHGYLMPRTYHSIYHRVETNTLGNLDRQMELGLRIKDL